MDGPLGSRGGQRATGLGTSSLEQAGADKKSNSRLVAPRSLKQGPIPDTDAPFRSSDSVPTALQRNSWAQ
jgi:hypothetical protein